VGGCRTRCCPVTGDIKGFLEVFTGCDRVTGEDLGAWRWAGLVPFAGPRLCKLRMVRHLHAVDAGVGVGKYTDEATLITRLATDVGNDAWWTSKGGEILDPTDPRYPPSQFPVYQQPDAVTCMPTCARMAGVADTIVADLEHLARSNQPPGLTFAELQSELAPRGWNVTISGEMGTSQALPQMASEVSTGKAVILRVPDTGGSGVLVTEHAVLIRSLEQSGSDWMITINDPATGKVVLLDRSAWTEVHRGGLIQYAVVSQ